MIRILIWGSVLALSGCTGYQYVASPQYVPVNLGKNKLNVNFSFNYYQVGYTLSNHLSVFTTGYFRNNNGGFIKATAFTKENGGNYVQTDKQRQFDFGLTYYRNPREYLNYEIVAGAGIGSVKYSNIQDLSPNYKFSIDAKKINIFIQPDLTFRFEKYLDVSFFSRIIHSRYYDLNKKLSLGTKKEPEKYDQYFSSRETVPLDFFEPGFQIRIGLENIKFQFSYTGVYDLKNTGIQYLKTNSFVGLSLRLTLGKKIK